MNFEPGWAIAAGLVGGAAMTAVLYMGMFMMPGQMKMNLLQMLGTMIFRPGIRAYVAGAMIHAMMSAVFGLVHGAAFAAADITSAEPAWGLLFGFVHWAVVGMALGMMPIMHPRLRYGGLRLVPAAPGNPGGDLIDPPGPYALNYPPATAMGFLMLHLLFGVVVGALYGAWVG